MPELKQLHAGHVPAALAFASANRAYFAASVPERGDDFLDRLTDRHNALLAASATVRELCLPAASRHGLHTVRAATVQQDAAPRKVLAEAGFVPVGPADPARLCGKPGARYQRDPVPEP